MAKKNRVKPSKALQSDFEAPQALNTEYYDREVKFKHRKRQQSQKSADLLNFLNETAVEKEEQGD